MFCERSLSEADRKELIDYLRSSLSCNQLSLENSIVEAKREVMSMPSYMLAGWKTRIDPGDCGDGDWHTWNEALITKVSLVYERLQPTYAKSPPQQHPLLSYRIKMGR